MRHFLFRRISHSLVTLCRGQLYSPKFSFSFRLNAKQLINIRHKTTETENINGVKNKVIPGNKDAPPHDFFDEDVESEKEFLDIASALSGAGLQNLTNLTEGADKISLEKLEKDDSYETLVVDQLKKLKNSGEIARIFERETEEVEDGEEYISGNEDSEGEEDPDDEIPLTRQESSMFSTLSADDVNKHIESLPDDSIYIPEELMNYSVEYDYDPEQQDPLLENFIPNTSTEKFRYDEQGLRSCPGSRQRRGNQKELNCHLIDLDDLHHIDTQTLGRFLTEDAEILNRKVSGLCSRCQRKVAKTIKRARHIGMLPHIGEFIIQDSRPLRSEKYIYHDCVDEKMCVVTKSIIK